MNGSFSYLTNYLEQKMTVFPSVIEPLNHFNTHHTPHWNTFMYVFIYWFAVKDAVTFQTALFSRAMGVVFSHPWPHATWPWCVQILFKLVLQDCRVIIWTNDGTDSQWTSKVLHKFNDVVWHVSWSVTGNILAVSGGDNKVGVFFVLTALVNDVAKMSRTAVIIVVIVLDIPLPLSLPTPCKAQLTCHSNAVQKPTCYSSVMLLMGSRDEGLASTLIIALVISH